jgi:ketosteroid isomerase-like protein
MATVATPEAAMRDVLDGMVNADAGALRALAAPDVRWLEERSGEWKDGVDGLIESARAAMEGTTDFGYEVGDVRTIELGGHAIVSAGLTFAFEYGGMPFRIACPATFVFAAADGTWRLVYQHTLAMPPAGEPG